MVEVVGEVKVRAVAQTFASKKRSARRSGACRQSPGQRHSPRLPRLLSPLAHFSASPSLRCPWQKICLLHTEHTLAHLLFFYADWSPISPNTPSRPFGNRSLSHRLLHAVPQRYASEQALRFPPLSLTTFV